jgi:hypothetical protein
MGLLDIAFELVRAGVVHSERKRLERKFEEMRKNRKLQEQQAPPVKKVWDAKTKHMLTEHEKAVAQESIFLFTGYWGSKIDGLSPGGAVAQERGAKFLLHCDHWLEPEEGKSERIANQAQDDVEEWLGLTHEEYLKLLPKEKEEIFKRAKW